jgi:hypothetical protein
LIFGNWTPFGALGCLSLLLAQPRRFNQYQFFRVLVPQ